MTNKDLKFLKKLHSKCKEENQGFLASKTFNLIFIICILIGGLILGFFFDASFYEAILLMLFGCSIGMLATLQAGEKNWKLLKPHIDIQSIENELNQKNT